KRWIPPTGGNAKMNVDAAVSRQGYGSIGVICRDQTGMFIGASTFGFRHIIDPPTLEALAIREALALADDLYLRRIEVASDCKVVVEDLQKDNSASYGAIVHEIIAHSSSFDFCSFRHDFRSSNYEAHNLARHALSLGGGHRVWLGHPGNLPSVPVNIVTN
uniref:RNase H type-1 domain-containing protein n=1 Tax=Aegilops tauschii subsp. strangulata TaxID=200361 RepID=A0A453NA43_AEGTS